jgi:hypothetical protein
MPDGQRDLDPSLEGRDQFDCGHLQVTPSPVGGQTQTDVVWYWAVSLLDDIDPPLWRVAP